MATGSMPARQRLRTLWEEYHAGHPGAEPAHPQIGAHEAVNRTPPAPPGQFSQIVQIGFQLRQRVIARGAVSPKGEMGGEAWYATARADSIDQGTILLQIRRFECWVIGKGPGDEAIDNFRRQSE